MERGCYLGSCSHAQGAYGQAGVFRWEHLIEMSGAEDLR